MNRTIILAIVVCVAVAIVATIIYQWMPTTSTQPTTPTAPTKPTIKLRVGYQPSWHHAAWFVMAEKGWINKVLGVEVQEHSFGSGPSEMEAFAAGSLDIAYVGATPPLSIIAKGAKAKIVAVANREGSSIVVRPDLEYVGPSSLSGKRISSYPPGSIQYTVLSYWLARNGVGGVEVIAQASPSDQLDALKTGSIDAVFTPDPHPYRAVIEGYGRIVVNSSAMWPNHPCCVVLMSQDLINEHRDLAAKIVALHVIASEYIRDASNKEEVKQILIKRLGITEGMANTFPGSTNFQTDPRDQDWLAGLDYMCQVLYELGQTKSPAGQPVRLTPGDFVDLTLYAEALNLVPTLKAELGLG
ncbi:MAG: ABC transporter substrate-binding protein [Candidatus Nezhaarchaeota archaeon]|nr:ABC transporter substrate-binding protein [Candidatus Nezhaarchaeota archaeon]